MEVKEWKYFNPLFFFFQTQPVTKSCVCVHMYTSHQQWVVDFKSRLCNKVVIRLEGDSEQVAFGVETRRSLLPTPAPPNYSAGFWLVLHFNIVIPAAGEEGRCRLGSKRHRDTTHACTHTNGIIKIWWTFSFCWSSEVLFQLSCGFPEKMNNELLNRHSAKTLEEKEACLAGTLAGWLGFQQSNSGSIKYHT